MDNNCDYLACEHWGPHLEEFMDISVSDLTMILWSGSYIKSLHEEIEAQLQHMSITTQRLLSICVRGKVLILTEFPWGILWAGQSGINLKTFPEEWMLLLSIPAGSSQGLLRKTSSTVIHLQLCLL